MSEKIYQYRLTKYNPLYRLNDVYCEDEWTSFFDVGKEYNGKIFTMDEYLKVENAYLKSIKLTLNKLNISMLEVTNMEKYSESAPNISNHTILSSVDDILNVAKECLRESCWCKLVGERFFIHFGYDYYMYIGCCIDESTMCEFASKNGLFSELIEVSPYLSSESEK